MRILSCCALLALTCLAYPALGSDARCGGESCESAIRGLLAFFDRKLIGLRANGRACADCHMPTDQFQLSPENAERRYRLLQVRKRHDPRADDPLFRPIDADDFRVHGDAAADFSNLRRNGLVRITFLLPPNIKLVDPLTNQPTSDAEVDVWRAVPTVNDVALTGPDGLNPWPRGPGETGGYQSDARFITLQEQALAALTTHAQAGRAVPPQMLDDLAAFQRNLFTSHRVKALADAVRAGKSVLPDPDPKLTALEKRGKSVFERACGQCHGGPGQTLTQPPIPFRFGDISTQCPRPVDTETPARFNFAPCPDRLARNAQTFEITLPDGTRTRKVSSDPGRALLTGFVGGPPPADDWNKLDVPGLRGIRHTAPYFHNNSAATLEDVVEHYIQFFNFVRATAPPNVVLPVASTDGVNWDRQPKREEVKALLAYLRRL